MPNGDGGIRTLDPLLARQVLSQLSYTPMGCFSFVFVFLSVTWNGYLRSTKFSHRYRLTSLRFAKYVHTRFKFHFRLFSSSVHSMGLSGLEPPTSRLSGVRSNQLSYKPFLIWQPPALPHRLQCSTIGRLWLNHRVRDGYGCFP